MSEEGIKATDALAKTVARALTVIQEAGEGGIAISYNPRDDGAKWAVAAQFGREAPDSPMTGGAIYGLGATPEDALERAVRDLL